MELAYQSPYLSAWEPEKQRGAEGRRSFEVSGS